MQIESRKADQLARLRIQETVAQIGQIMPDLVNPQNTMGNLLNKADWIRFDPKSDGPGDIFQIYSGTHYGRDLNLRLYGTPLQKSAHLQFTYQPEGLSREIFCAWEGGALNSKDPELYINLKGQQDFRFNPRNQTLEQCHNDQLPEMPRVLILSPGEDKYPNWRAGDSDRLTHVGLDAGNNLSLTFTRPAVIGSTVTALTLPTVINSINWSALQV